MKNITESLKKIIKKNYTLYKILSSDKFSLHPVSTPPYYPTDIGIELTTHCNSRCTFCTHEELVVKSKKKEMKQMDFKLALRVLDKTREITKLQNIPEEEIRIGFNGLGEPLLYPQYFEVVKYARSLFPKATFTSNTNCLALTEEKAKKLINCGLDDLTLSLAFNDSQSYKEGVGIDKYNLVVKNITTFLKLKGTQKPNANLYVFDKYMNKKNFKTFTHQWGPLMNANDSYHIRQLLPIYDWSPKPGEKFPCYELWSLFLVDVNGYLFPCCMALWIQKNENLCIGHIDDSPTTILNNLNAIRERHVKGDYRICACCGVLSDQKARCKKAYKRVKRLDRIKVKIPNEE